MGTFDMAKAMANDEVYLFISKRYSVAEWARFAENNQKLMDRIVHASCKGENDAANLYFTLDSITEIRRVYLNSKTTVLSENFKKFVQKVKAKYPFHAIMVGKTEETPLNVNQQRDAPPQNVWL